MSLRTATAQALSSISAATLKNVFRRPAGNFPGKIALYADPLIIEHTAAKLTKGSISVVGTNGKTTVTGLIADCLEAQGMRVVCNRTGANLDSGVATSLLGAGESDWGVFETDEMWLAKTLPQLKSRYVILLNLFRDQLDRVGEVERIQDSIVGALCASPETILIYNADDPVCEAIARRVDNETMPFGIDQDLNTSQSSANDAPLCQMCDALMTYEYRHYNQLGKYACPSCDFARSPLRFAARSCAIDAQALSFDVVASLDSDGVAGGTLAHIEAGYAGTYMIYNLLAAFIGAHVAGAQTDTITRVFETYNPQNGRLQTLTVQGKQVLINLAKNPTGFNQNINLICKDTAPKVVAFFVNDHEGDGRDISWLWDIDFEDLRARCAADELQVFAGGLRRNDVQLRLKYAGIAAALVDDATDVMSRIGALPDTHHVYMIANYTSLPDVRSSMEQLAAGTGTITAPPLRVGFPALPDETSDAPQVWADDTPVKLDTPLRIVHVLPDILNLYGDAGNVRILQQRCAWRGIPVEVIGTALDEPIDFEAADIVVLGTGTERVQTKALDSLKASRESLAQYVEDGGVMLAVCGGFQMLGTSLVVDDEPREGLGIIEATTCTSAHDKRHVGDIALRSSLTSAPIIGYENHMGTTELADGVAPFGTIINQVGFGNNAESSSDGALVNNLVATFAHGPVLAKSPELADELIARALQHRTGAACTLGALDDTVETEACNFMCDRLGVH